MFRTTRKLLYPFRHFENFNVEKKHLLQLIEYQSIGINTELAKTNCDIDKFLLSFERDELVKLKNQINQNSLSQEEIKEKRQEISDRYNRYNNITMNKKNQ